MRRWLFCVASIAVLTGTAAGQWGYPPIPGFNVGFSPHASFALTSYAGQPAFFLVIPGQEDLASFHDPLYLPPGTLRVQLDMHALAVLEPSACAVGAGLYFETQLPLGGNPFGHVATTGWDVHTAAWPWPFRWMEHEPFHSTWFLSYCTIGACTSPCGPEDRDPDWEAYLMTVRLL